MQDKRSITGKPELMRKMNMTLLYEALIELRTATRAELSSRTQISTTTIRALLEELVVHGEIEELKLDQSSGGRRAQRYALHPQRNLILSLYFNNNMIIYQVSNLAKSYIETGNEKLTGDDTTASIVQFINHCKLKWNICAIGLGVPGIVDHGCYYFSKFNSPSPTQFETIAAGSSGSQWITNDIGKELQNSLQMPVILENDLNCIALGYAIHYIQEHPGYALEQLNMAYIYFTNDCTGAGIIADGKLIHGAKQFAGELGFLPLEDGQTLSSLLKNTTALSEKLAIMARTIAIVNCVTNPSFVVISCEGSLNDQIDIKQLNKALDRFVPSIQRPVLFYSDHFEEDYLTGLTYLTQRTLLPLLPIDNSMNK